MKNNSVTGPCDETKPQVALKIGAHQTGVQHVSCNACARQPPRQLVSEHDIGKFGAPVGHETSVIFLELQIIEIHLYAFMRRRRHIDYAGRSAGLQPLKEQIGQQEVAQVVEGESLFKSFRCHLPMF